MISDQQKNIIQQGYRNFLKHRELKPRQGQRQMIGMIASMLGNVELDAEGHRQSSPAVCAVEAGTGTGKTLAYLLAALPMAKALDKKVIIATGTVALQSQLLDKDIPELVAATGWQHSFALAKGRGRYLCNIRLEQCLNAVSAQESNQFLFEDEVPFQPSRSAMRVIRTMDTALDENRWDGDRDSWPDAVEPSLWRALSVDRRQCTGRRCRKVSACCFFRARDAIEDADCIIANHDLVMSDLALGGGAILPAPEDSIYIFDEAHRLGENALRHFSGHAAVQGTITWLGQIARRAKALAPEYKEAPEVVQSLEKLESGTESCITELQQIYSHYQQLLDTLLPASGGNQYRFPHGDVGDTGRAMAENLQADFSLLVTCLSSLATDLERALENSFFPVPRVDVEQLFQLVGSWQGRAEATTALWSRMAEKDTPGSPPLARWLNLEESVQDISVSVSPITASGILMENLWQRAFATVATSATLRSLGSFARFNRMVGLPKSARCEWMPGAFDYANAGVLAVPNIGADGSNAAEHTQALINALPGLVNEEDGTLVLFSSQRQMQEVAEAMSTEFREQLLIQGEHSNQEIVRRHRTLRDREQGSVIFGLASFAEGMDLPGHYCNHVIIAKLPFAVPDDPLQSAQAEWLETQGENPFQAMTLPDASLRLIQACGRLLRTESDRGRITLLDRRVLTKAYGRKLLDALPPFRRELG